MPVHRTLFRLIFLAFVIGVVSSWAQQPDVAQLKSQMQELRQMMQNLE
jgi:hypothetical protein